MLPPVPRPPSVLPPVVRPTPSEVYFLQYLDLHQVYFLQYLDLLQVYFL
jgi:hypothetical protein